MQGAEKLATAHNCKTDVYWAKGTSYSFSTSTSLFHDHITFTFSCEFPFKSFKCFSISYCILNGVFCSNYTSRNNSPAPPLPKNPPSLIPKTGLIHQNCIKNEIGAVACNSQSECYLFFFKK